ncbi:MAG: methylated-DNA--[protein]-cysteine S-methyltransferase [Dongiaceae bacterium]
MRPAAIPKTVRYAGRIETPLGGAVALVDDERRLIRFGFLTECERGRWQVPQEIAWDEQAVAPVAQQIHDYFSGQRKNFDLPLAPRGTDFQQAVWAALRRIPFGATTSYARLAGQLGRPTSYRAVGAANGANPIALIVPCHRVIGTSGDLTGYAGGLALKEALLRFEGADF